MKNFKNRAIAFLLAFAMVATTMFSDVSMISADDTVVTSTEEAVASNEDTAPAAAATDEAAPSNEEAAPTETTDVAAPAETTGEATQAETTEEAAQAATTEEAAPAETTQTETTDEAAPVTTTEATAPVTTTETTPAATETPAVTETPAAAPAETPAAATYTQAVSGSSSYNGVTVTVNAPVGAFQDGTTLAITPIESSSVNNTVAGAMGENFSGAVAFDITFSYNGVEVQPAAGYNVDVNFTVTPASSIVDSSAETQDIKVFHLESEGSAAQQINAVTDVPVDATALVDSAANSFSIYVVATTTKARATYNFYNGNTEVGSQVVKAGDTVILPTSPSEEGAVFTGWYDTADGTNGNLISTTVSNVTAGTTYNWYAHFETAHYVYYKESAAADARTLFSEKVIAGSEVPLDKTFEVKTDKALIGWSTDPNATEALTEYTMGTSDVNLYPVIKEAHWLTFNSEGGTSVDPVSVINGSAPVKPSDPTKTGYSFGGWYTDESCSDANAFNWESTLTENTILYAKWTPATANYTVVYWQESLTPGADGSIQYDYISSSSQSGTTGSNADISTFETAVYGFHYASYATNNTSDTTALTIAADGTTVINLYYNRNLYTFTFSLPGYNGDAYGRYKVPEDGLKNAVLTMGNISYSYNGSAYSFTAKYGEDIGNKWPTASNISGSYKYWGTNYDLTNQFRGWSGGSTSVIHSSKRFNVTKELIKTDTDGATQSFKGNWETGLNSYNLHYFVQDADDSSVYSELSEYAQTANSPNGFSAKDIAGFTKISGTPSGYKASSGYTYYFYYNRTSSNLNLHNIANETSTSIRYGKNIYSNLSAEVAAPSGKSGFTFGGWYTTVDCKDGSEYSYNENTTMPAGNLDLYAKWVAPTISVTFNLNGGSNELGDYSKQEIPYGTTATKPVNPERYHYEFAGWTRDGVAFNFESTALTADTVLVAKWIGQGHENITYNANAVSGTTVTGSVPTDNTLYRNTASAKVLSNGELSISGYAFICWNTQADGKGTDYYPGSLVSFENGSVTLYAKWESTKNTTSVTYDYNGGTDANNKETSTIDNIVVNDNVAVPTIESLGVTKEGYYFTGWKTKQNEIVTDGDYFADSINPDENVLIAQWCKKDAVTFTGESGTEVYNGSEQSLTGITPTGLLSGHTYDGLTYRASGTNVGTYDGAFTGTVVIRDANGKDVTNHYEITSTPGTLEITKGAAKDNAVTATSYNEVYDAAAHTITASAAQAGSTLYYSKIGGADATDWSTTTPTWTDVTAAQTVYVKAVNANYEDAFGQATVTINPATITVKAENASKAFDTPDPLTFAYDVTQDSTVSGEKAGFEGALARTSGEAVGNYDINQGSLVLKDNGTFKATNYTLGFTKGIFNIYDNDTLSLTANGYEGTYDGAEHSATASASVTTAKIEYSTDGGTNWSETAPSIKDVGTQEVQVRASATGYTTKTKTVTLKVNPATITVKAENASKAFDTPDPLTFAYDVTQDSMVSGEKAGFEGALARTSGEAVGNYDINQGSLVLKDNGTFKATNYTLGFTKGIFNIYDNDTLSLTANGYEGTYDGAEHSATASASVTTAKIEYSTDGGTNWSETAPSIKDVGTQEVQVRASATGYTTKTKTVTLKVNPATITVKAENASKAFDTPDPLTFAYDVTQDSTVSGEKAGFEGALARTSGEAVGNYDINQGSLVLKDNGTFKATNYTLGFTKGIFNIYDNDTLSLTANGYEGTYDGAEHSATASASVTTAKIEYSTDGGTNWSETAPSIKDVGTQEVQVRASATGYTTKTKTVTLKVNPVAIKVTAASASKIVDGTALTNNGYTADAPVDGEKIISVKITGSQTSIGSSANVASDAVIKRGDIDTTKNYKITYVDGTLTVNPVPFVAAPSMSSAKTITNRHADGTGFAAGETVNFSITVTNTGNVVLNNVKVVDEMTKLDTTIKSIAIGETETVTTSYTVTQADIDNRVTLTNTATVTPSDPGVTPQNPQIIIPIATPTASIASVKTITSTPANGVAYAAGETVTFAITVTNTGNTTQNNVAVTDALTGLNTTIATIPVGQSATVNTSYTVTAADVAAGTLSNTAVVTPGPDPTNPNPTPQNPTVIIPIAPPIVPATPVVPPVVPTAPTTTTTTTTTTDTTTTVAPAPAATAPTASVGTTTVTVPDTKVPLADGGLKYTLTAIGDNTVPLASGTDEHKCCILHFLLLLVALVVEIFYIRSAKKHQKRIHELRRQIADEKQKLELINDRNAENQQVG